MAEGFESQFNGFFEGAEKLLEIWFVRPGLQQESEQVSESRKRRRPSRDESKGPLKKGLRTVKLEKIVAMLDKVACKILNTVEHDLFDAYLLSESSLFVYEDRVILKTCGTTTLLHAIPFLLEFSKDKGLSLIGDVFYSHRNFVDEKSQADKDAEGHHGPFDAEVKYLDSFFDGSAYTVGKQNGQDQWHLYLTDKPGFLVPPEDSDSYKYVRAPTSSKVVAPKGSNITRGKSLVGKQIPKLPTPQPDYTLELLMTNLNRDKMDQFYHKGELKDTEAALAAGVKLTKTSGISRIVPGAEVDGCAFAPCGYSCNAQLDGGYYTIHVTPQPICSYVSFETNIVTDKDDDGVVDYSKLVARVLDVFQPYNFTLTLFGGHVDEGKFTKMCKKIFSQDCFKHFKRNAKSSFEFENDYQLVYAHYQHEDLIDSEKKGIKLAQITPKNTVDAPPWSQQNATHAGRHEPSPRLIPVSKENPPFVSLAPLDGGDSDSTDADGSHEVSTEDSPSTSTSSSSSCHKKSKSVASS